MKFRFDSLAVSSGLFTLAILLLTPSMVENARATHQSMFRDISDFPVAGMAPDQVVIPNYRAPIGIASLTIMGIGLIVTWAGYVKRIRWTWFVLFAVVWLWAFPVLVLPFFYPWTSTISFAQTLASTLEDAINEGGMGRAFVEIGLAFLLMLFALVLPIKGLFLGGGNSEAATDQPSQPDYFK